MISASEKDSLLARLNQHLQPIDQNLEALGIHPDLHVTRVGDIDLDMISVWGVQHVLMDYDGIFVNGTVNATIDEEALKFAQAVVRDSRFKSIHIATDNGTGNPSRLTSLIGPETKVFTPYDHPEYTHFKTGPNGSPNLYRRILFELGDGMLDHPETVVMIGDSPYHDVMQAQKAGMRTVLVDSIIKRKY